MTSGYILIAAILLLGGLIAALGDRLGSKVGKARLRLFNLRPKQTAVVVTVLTGTLIASSTLGILFALSKSLRQGVFELDDILEKRRQVKQELIRVTEEKNQIEEKLAKARAQQIEATQSLAEINTNYQASLEKLKNASKGANSLREDVKSLLTQRQELLATKEKLNSEVGQLRKQLQQQSQQIASQDKILKDKENQQKILATEIQKRDRIINNLDRSIRAKDEDLRGKETRVKQLESQLVYIKKELDVLDQYYQTYQELREKRIALGRGQVLAFGTVKVVEPKAAVEAIDYLLREANRNAIKAVNPTDSSGKSTARVVQITKAQVDQLAEQIKDGRNYVIRIVSAGNYVQGEKQVKVFADLSVNQEIFQEDQEVATTSIDREQMSQEELQKRLDLLLSAAQFRAKSAGIVGDIQVENGSITAISDFLNQLTNSEDPIEEIKAIASETSYTSGPLKLRLLAISKGKILFTTLEK